MIFFTLKGYLSMRALGGRNSLTITATTRQLESLIRLSQVRHAIILIVMIMIICIIICCYYCYNGPVGGTYLIFPHLPLYLLAIPYRSSNSSIISDLSSFDLISLLYHPSSRLLSYFNKHSFIFLPSFFLFYPNPPFFTSLKSFAFSSFLPPYFFLFYTFLISLALLSLLTLGASEDETE